MIVRTLLLLAGAPLGALVLQPKKAARVAARRPRGLAAVPDGWVDLSGDGRCVQRVLRAGSGPPPCEGATCTVRWTAWLAEREGVWWRRGERVGLQCVAPQCSA